MHRLPPTTGYYKTAAVAAIVMAYPYVVRVKQSPAFVRFILAGAGWFKVRAEGRGWAHTFGLHIYAWLVGLSVHLFMAECYDRATSLRHRSHIRLSRT